MCLLRSKPSPVDPAFFWRKDGMHLSSAAVLAACAFASRVKLFSGGWAAGQSAGSKSDVGQAGKRGPHLRRKGAWHLLLDRFCVWTVGASPRCAAICNAMRGQGITWIGLPNPR